MKVDVLLKKLEGIQTINSVMSLLNINKKKAIYHIYRLRKQGYIKTKRTKEGIRIYNISPENRIRGVTYQEIINKCSPIKISSKSIYKIYGKTPSLEETLIYAVKTKSPRTILAALSLFRRIENWSELYKLAKKNHIERQVGALYDLARKIMKARKMTKRFRNNALPKKQYKFEYTVKCLKSRDFTDIQDTWRIFLPFNKKDLEDYK